MSKVENHWNDNADRRLLLHALVLQNEQPEGSRDLKDIWGKRLGLSPVLATHELSNLAVDGIIQSPKSILFTDSALEETTRLAEAVYHLSYPVKYGPGKEDVKSSLDLVKIAYTAHEGRNFHDIITGAIEQFSPKIKRIPNSDYTKGSLCISRITTENLWSIVLLTHPTQAPLGVSDMAMANLVGANNLAQGSSKSEINILCGSSFASGLFTSADDKSIFLMDIFSFLELNYYLSNIPNKNREIVNKYFLKFFTLDEKKKGGYVDIGAGCDFVTSQFVR